MGLSKVLAISAIGGILVGATACGGNNGPGDAKAPSTEMPSGEKASCSAGHTEKNHCNAAQMAADAGMPAK